MKLLPEPTESSDTDDVSAALHLLGESLETEVQRINTEGSQAMRVGDYDSETIRLMAEIDQVIDSHGGWLGAFAGNAE
jgi:hypothetical protein